MPIFLDKIHFIVYHYITMNKISIISNIAVAALAVGVMVFSPFVLAANQPPVWEYMPNKAVFTNQLLQFTVYAGDIDGDTIIYSAFNLPSGAVFNPQTRMFSWTPTSGQTGTYTVVFRAYDGVNTIDNNVQIIVTSPNPVPSYSPPAPPAPVPPPPFSVSAPYFVNFNPPLVAVEGQLYTYTVIALNPSGGSLNYRLISAPVGMTINAVGVISWVPAFNQARPDPYLVTVGASNISFETTRSYNLTVLDAVSTPPPVTPPPASGGNGGAPVTPLTISNIKVEAVDGDILITWDTNKLARGRVIYDTESHADEKEPFTYEFVTPDTSQAVRSHSVTLSGDELESGTTYYFRAVAKTNGQTVTSNELTFETEGVGLTLAFFGSLGEFLANPWLYAILAIIIIVLIYKRLNKKSA